MLENLIERAIIAGFIGVAVWKQGKQFVIAGLLPNGGFSETRLWEPMDDLNAAITRFGDTLSKIVPGQGK